MLTKIKNWFLALLFPPTIVIEETLTGSPPAQHVEEFAPRIKEQAIKKSHSAIPHHIKVKGSKGRSKR